MQKRFPTDDSPEQKMPRWDFLYQMAKLQEQEKKRLQEEKQVKELEMDPQCTFKPQLLNAQIENQTSFLERQKQWVEQKKQKNEIRKEKYNGDEKELKECTFKPTISQSKTFSDQPATSNTKAYDNYVNRQKLAREQKQQKQFMLNNPYSHLSGEKKLKDGSQGVHPITSQYETQKNAERIEFMQAVSQMDEQQEPSDEGSQEKCKIQLGTAIKLLHNELHNIQFESG